MVCGSVILLRRKAVMLLRWSVLVFLVLLPCAVSAATVLDGPAILKPVTLSVKGESLSDIAALLRKQTNARITVAKDIADRKATVFVDDKPLKDVMVALAKLFGYTWRVRTRNDVKSYELYLKDKDLSGWEEAREAAWKSAWSELEGLCKLAELSREKLEERQSELEARNDDSEEIQREMRQIIQMLNPGPTQMACRQISKLSQQARQALESGAEVCYSTASSEIDWELPNEAKDSAASVFRAEMQSSREMGPAGMADEDAEGPKELAFSRVDLQFSVGESADTVCINSNMHAEGRGHSFDCGGNLVSEAISVPERERAWDIASAAREAAIEKLSDKKLSLSSSELTQEADIPGQLTTAAMPYVNRSDVLSLLHRKMGLQIISDHYSAWGQFQPVKDGLLLDVMSDLGNGMSRASYYLDGGFLCLRSYEPEDETEIPNRVLRPWQAKYAAEGSQCMDKLLPDVALLPQRQRDELLAESQYLRLWDRRCLDVVTNIDWPALRLYRLLTPDQRKLAASTGISFARMKDNQRTVLVDLMSDEERQQSREVPRVGIYRDGIRVDKTSPEPEGKDPIRIAMRRIDTPDSICYNTTSSYLPSPGQMCEIGIIEAETLDEAWKQMRKDHPTLGPRNLIRVHRTDYILTVEMVNGEKWQRNLVIPVVASYEEIKGLKHDSKDGA
jgi:hypothetical protein